MPIKHAALKEIRKGRRRQTRNQSIRSELRMLTKRLTGLVEAQKLDEASTLLPLVTARFDRAVSKGIIHRNTAARHKSRLTLRLNRSRSR